MMQRLRAKVKAVNARVLLAWRPISRREGPGVKGR